MCCANAFRSHYFFQIFSNCGLSLYRKLTADSSPSSFNTHHILWELGRDGLAKKHLWNHVPQNPESHRQWITSESRMLVDGVLSYPIHLKPFMRTERERGLWPKALLLYSSGKEFVLTVSTKKCLKTNTTLGKCPLLCKWRELGFKSIL